MWLSFVLLTNVFYWLPYALRGVPHLAFYEFGGHVAFWYINPAVGFFGGLLHAVAQLATDWRWPWRVYVGSTLLWAAIFLVAGL